MENGGEGAGGQRRGLVVRTRREPWPWKRHLICCRMNVCVRRVDEAVATSIQELYQKELSGAARA